MAIVHKRRPRGCSPPSLLRSLTLWILLTGVSAAGATPPLAWQQHPGFHLARLPGPSIGGDGFSRVDALRSGLVFTNLLPESLWITNVMLLNGSGAAAGDVDGDGWVDLFVTSLQGPEALFKNLGGWRFTNVTQQAGLDGEDLLSTGCALADLDGDGDLDLIINSFGQGTWLLKNDGKGHFTRRQVMNEGTGPASMALADTDGDGDLDLYVANYRAWTFRDRPGTKVTLGNEGDRKVVTHFGERSVTNRDLAGRFTIDPARGLEEHGEADLFALNNGRGEFTPIPFTEGAFLDERGLPLTHPPQDWGLSVMMRDLDGDGAPDIYVCNDFESPDRIWINQGGGRFRALPETAVRSSSRFSMGMDAADINRDGIVDLFVSDMLSPHHARRHLQLGNVGALYHRPGSPEHRLQYSRNTLLLGEGQGSFSEIGAYAGVVATDWTWGVAFMDVDLDGYEDLLAVTGNEIDSMNIDITNEQQAMRLQRRMSAEEVLQLRKLYGRLDLPKVAFRNSGSLTFTRMSREWGFDSKGVATGLALADFDNDGDQDVVIQHINGPLEVLRNNAAASRLAVRLAGNGLNRKGIGARIVVRGGPVTQSQEMVAGGRYLSSDDAMRVFACGHAQALDVEVHWRSGRTSRITNLPPNSIIEVVESGAVTAGKGRSTPPGPLFSDASDQLNHTHADEPFADFDRQPLLPQQLSHLGPGVCWHDIDGDGWEDLAVGAGRGGTLGLFLNQQGKGFSKATNGVILRRLSRDQTTLLATGSTLITGSANYEDGLTNGGCLRVVNLDANAAGESVSGMGSSPGPMSMADLDGDGDLDLFVGGRVVAGRYPQAASSLLLRNDAGRFVTTHRWEALGLVSGSLFTDLDGDGRLELVLACDWDSLRIFRLDGFRPVETSGDWGIREFRGRWNSVEAGDFDGDGHLDLVAGNFGLNHSLNGFSADGLRLFHGALSGQGAVDLIEAYRDLESGQIRPSRVYSSVSAALPFIKERVPTYGRYAQLTVVDLLADRAPLASELHASNLASTVFLNRSGRLVPSPLPAEAQFAPVYGIAVADLDGDGAEDLFLGQNLFAVSPDGWRMDGGRGCVLSGDGRGGFRTLSVHESGVRMHAEQRGVAAADFDQDGRVDVAVGQNSAETRLYRNQGARPGLRVRLEGSREGWSTANARIVPYRGGRPGPIREIRMGSGYWSQVGSVLVFSGASTPEELEVQWWRGDRIRYVIPKTATRVTLQRNGEVSTH